MSRVLLELYIVASGLGVLFEFEVVQTHAEFAKNFIT